MRTVIHRSMRGRREFQAVIGSLSTGDVPALRRSDPTGARRVSTLTVSLADNSHNDIGTPAGTTFTVE
jgi:hypothetical protein